IGGEVSLRNLCEFASKSSAEDHRLIAVEVCLAASQSPPLNLAQILPNTTELMMAESGITTIEPLHGMRQLRRLSLNNTSVVDLTPISNSPNLECLHLVGTRITDLWAVGSIHSLKELDLQGTQITYLFPLSQL